MSITPQKLLAQLAATPGRRALPSPRTQPVLLPDLAEAIAGGDWLSRDHARREALPRRQGMGSPPWLTKEERKAVARQLERQARG